MKTRVEEKEDRQAGLRVSGTYFSEGSQKLFENTLAVRAKFLLEHVASVISAYVTDCHLHVLVLMEVTLYKSNCFGDPNTHVSRTKAFSP